MRRREILGVGMGVVATAVGAPTRAQQTDAERVVAATRGVPGLATGASQSGDSVLFGFDDGNVVVYDDRDGTVIPIDVDRSVSHIAVSDAATAAVVGWMDADVFARLDLATVDGTFVEHVGLWDLATTPDAGRTASVSSPAATPGSVRVADSDGSVLWDTPFGDATGQSVAIADGGTRIAVGAGHYWADGTEPTGQPGVRLYDGTGTEQWHHDHGADVLAVGIDAERELVVAGTDDGHTIVLDVDGQVVWETAAVGGWLVLSADGGTILAADTDGTLYAIVAATGEVRWTADIGMWPAADLSVSADGGTWSTIVTDLAAESARLAVYRTPDTVAAPESAPPRDAPPADEDPAAEDDESSDETGDDNDDDDDEDDESPSDPVSLALADYHILGE
ncbi:WD40 repeat domain-containing protein [Natrinema sp. H-ect4]|uniref:WD40 repeat domain-containing protein n=1 Tax=Natrinema sp. H-ect4 TaxID=3242699 RepID=UPI0035A955E9